MKRRTFVGLAASAAVLPALPAAAQAYPWRPERPVTIIVPWAAGGSTDQMARIVAAELESELGQRFVVVNQPGASGSIGTRNAMEAARDGHTWAAGAAADVGTYKVLGMLDTSLADWNLFLAVANVSAISVNPNTPYRDFGQLLEVLKTRGATVPVATAGLSSAGHNMMEMVRAAVPGLQYRHVTYEGGNPAVVATVAGETPVVCQLLVEMTEMIRGNRLRPLVVLSDKPVTLAGHGEIPPITRWVPGMVAPVNYFGIWIPKGAPEPVVRTMTMAWERKIANSEALKRYATDRSALFTPIHGEEAHSGAMQMVRQTAWLYHDAGKSKVSPDTVGIPRP
ncbi:Bug family tripartite tricarboxylate transporter substrate binding protein [Elioraea sp.]|uniref:Bug family tripartite tricarboxylate transporter substrate binding protein n=1 Tax=Elioraea sp. TaxID=2185103 RepID=UPI003F7195AD